MGVGRARPPGWRPLVVLLGALLGLLLPGGPARGAGPQGWGTAGPLDLYSGHLFCNTFVAQAAAVDPAGVAGLSFYYQDAQGTATLTPLGPPQALQDGNFRRVLQVFRVPAGQPYVYLEARAVSTQGYTTVFPILNLFTGPSDLQDCPVYADVTGADPVSAAIRYLKAAGIALDVGGSYLCPYCGLYRAQMAKVAVQALGYKDPSTLPSSPPPGCNFYDVSPSDPYAPYIWKACQLGVMVGYGGYRAGYFGPYDYLENGQLLVVVHRLGIRDNTGTGHAQGSIIRSELYPPAYTYVCWQAYWGWV